MADIEKVKKELELVKQDICEAFVSGSQIAVDCLWIDNAIAILKDLEAEPPIHVHEEYPEHDWETDEKGEVDDCAWGQEYCNGPMCKRCYYSFCIHCEPNGWDKKPCIVDFFKCPGCGERISESTKFCSNCGKEVKWE